MTSRNVHRSELPTPKPLATGGTAKIYGLGNFQFSSWATGEWVFKEYKKKFRPPVFGMRQLAGFLTGLEAPQRDQFLRCITWPAAVVVDDKSAAEGALGVLLPLIPNEYFVDLRLSRETKRKAAEGQFLFQSETYCRKVGIQFADQSQRLSIVARLVYAIGLLHKANVVYGDLSARNFLYRLNPRPGVILLEGDCVRLPGARAGFGAQPHTPDWEPPEALEAIRRKDSTGFAIQSKHTDEYKLGLAVLRIMTPGVPSSNRDPEAARGKLPSGLYQFLLRSLSADPTQRPATKEWYAALKESK
jgi:DNA-binding helix-hairpin-helix protein with protein kinase domain